MNKFNIKDSDVEIEVEEVKIDVESVSTVIPSAQFATVKYVNEAIKDKVVDITDEVIDGKVDKEEGKRLITQEEVEKLASLDPSANKNVQADWRVSDNTSDAYIKNKPTTLEELGISGIISNNDLEELKENINYKLQFKSDKSDTYSKKDTDKAISSAVSKRALKTDVYTKEETETIIGIAIESKANKSDVLTKNETNAIIYNATKDFAKRDLVYTKDEVDSNITSAVSTKENKGFSYSKSETDRRINNAVEGVTEGFVRRDDVYIKSEINNRLNEKANLSDVYTSDKLYTKDESYNKTEVDTKIESSTSNLANKSDVYTKTEVDAIAKTKEDKGFSYCKEAIDNKIKSTKDSLDAKINLKANISDVYTKTEVDTIAKTKEDKGFSYCKEAIDNKIKSTKDSLEAKINLKEDKGFSYCKEVIDDKIKKAKDSLYSEINLKANISDVYTKDEVYDKKHIDGVVEKTTNVIEAVKVNGNKLPVDGKVVSITIPTGSLADKSSVSEGDLDEAVREKLNSLKGQSDWSSDDEQSPSYIKNKPTKLSDFKNDLPNNKYVELVEKLPTGNDIQMVSYIIPPSTEEKTLKVPLDADNTNIIIEMYGDNGLSLKDVIGVPETDVTEEPETDDVIETPETDVTEEPETDDVIETPETVELLTLCSETVNDSHTTIVIRKDKDCLVFQKTIYSGESIESSEEVNGIEYKYIDKSYVFSLNNNVVHHATASSSYALNKSLSTEFENSGNNVYTKIKTCDNLKLKVSIYGSNTDYTKIVESKAVLALNSTLLNGEIFDADCSLDEFRTKFIYLWQQLGGAVINHKIKTS